MSMLAERKRKQKWSLNPRGKEWSQDANKFGQKMLEKMGWQHGKGLGANEDGITEHVKVSYKNDSKGIGYKESNDQWTEHETHFSALLESLSGTVEQTDETKPKSLEKKSQTSRARVHYHKFTRGKDLSRYSEKDLANIFGKKSLKEPKQEEVKEENPSSKIEKLEKESKFLRNTGSMKDYFKKKLPNFGKANGLVIGSNGVLKKEESDTESEVRPSFSLGDGQYGNAENINGYVGFGYKREDDFNCQLNDNLGQRRDKETFISYLNGEENTETKKKLKIKRKIEEYNEYSILSPRKKSKKIDADVCKKKSQNALEVDLGLSNLAFNPLCTPVKVQKHVLTTIEEIICEEISLEENSLQVIEMSAEVGNSGIKNAYETVKEGYNSETPKKTKKKTRSEHLDAVEVSNSEDKKKYKRKKEPENEFCKMKPQENKMEYSASDASSENGGNHQESNKKKKKVNILAIDNPNFEETSQEPETSLRTEENPFEVRRPKEKKKKKNANTADENVGGDGSKPQENEMEYSSSDASSENGGNHQESNKKKKKANILAIDNPNFEETSQDPEESLQTEENAFEVRRPKEKKKKKTKTADGNVGCDGSIEETVDCSEVKGSQHKVNDTGKKKKKRKEKLAPENTSSNTSTDDSADFLRADETSYEVKRKKKQKTKFALENPSFNGTAKDSTDSFQVEENPFEEKRMKTLSLENPSFDDAHEESVDFSQMKKNPYEVKLTEKKKKKKKKEDHLAIENHAFNDSTDISTDFSQIEENQFEIISENKKTVKKKEKFAIDNPQFDPIDSLEGCKKKLKTPKVNKTQDCVVNSAVNSNTLQSEIKEDISIDIEASDLMLNVVTTPVVSKVNTTKSESAFSIPNASSIKRRKSVRFSDVTQERIIPNNEDLKNLSDMENRNELYNINTQVLNSSLQNQNQTFDAPSVDANQRGTSKKQKLGLDNMAFNKQQNSLDENVDFISKTLDKYQAEIENDINEKKVREFRMEDVMVGEVGNPHGENEKLSEGTKLKFKYAHLMTRTPFYQLNKTGAKKGYKHLIKGDIVVKFNNTNLHEIDGYAVKSKRAVV